MGAKREGVGETGMDIVRVWKGDENKEVGRWGEIGGKVKESEGYVKDM